MLAGGFYSNIRGGLERVAIDACADGWERDAFALELFRRPPRGILKPFWSSTSCTLLPQGRPAQQATGGSLHASAGLNPIRREGRLRF